MREDFHIDRKLPSRLDNLLKEGSLDGETEILKILETLSEKLSAIESKGGTSGLKEKGEERRKIHYINHGVKTHLAKKYNKIAKKQCFLLPLENLNS